MKVARWYNNRDIRIEDMPAPSPGPGEMRVKVTACGICGSDVVEWYRLPRAPLIPGHEIGGVVVETGEGVTRFRTGDRVFVAPKVPCLACDSCRNRHYPVCAGIKDRLPGGFAEYVLVPRALVDKGAYRLPASISDDQSTFIEPLACVVRAQALAGVVSGQRVLVIGCGMSGLLHVRLAKAGHCSVVAVDVNPFRLAAAARCGADRTLAAAAQMEEVTADTVFLCTSALSAVELAWKSVDKGGAVVFFAVPGPDKEVRIPINAFWTREIRILTSYYCGPPDIDTAMAHLASGSILVDDLITHRLPLAEIQKGFQLVMDADRSIKVIIRPHD